MDLSALPCDSYNLDKLKMKLKTGALILERNKSALGTPRKSYRLDWWRKVVVHRRTRTGVLQRPFK
jgi:hypothetical protein